MIYTETVLKGVFVIDIEPVKDERGLFAKTWGLKEFVRMGLSARGRNQVFRRTAAEGPCGGSTVQPARMRK